MSVDSERPAENSEWDTILFRNRMKSYLTVAFLELVWYRGWEIVYLLPHLLLR